MLKKAFLSVLFLSFLMFVGIANAEEIENPFTWSASLSKSTAKQGETVTFTAIAKIKKGHYIAKSMTSASSVENEDVSFGKIELPKPIIEQHDGHDKPVYRDSLKIVIPVLVKGSQKNTKVAVSVSYQGCSDHMCFMPSDTVLSVDLSINGVASESEKGSVAAVVEDDETLDSDTGSMSGTIKKGGIIALLFAFLAGLLNCLTPCVYPLIPVTLAIFGASKAKSRLESFSLASTYFLGIVFMFATLGIIAGKTGMVFGQYLGSPWFAGFLLVIFVGLSLSLFGLYDLQLPESLNSKLSSMGGTGYGRIFIMGIVAAFIAAPCVGPSMVAIIGIVATGGSQSLVMGTLLLVAFGSGLGFPFLLLGTFSNAISSRPKPGPWMDHVKSILGIIVLIAALYLVRGAFPVLNDMFPRTQFNLTLMSLLVIAGFLMGAVDYSYHGTSTRVKIQKTFAIMSVVIFSFGIMMALMSEPVVVNAESSQKTEWIKNLDEGLALAKDEGKPVIIDFSAKWCTSCHELEKLTFSEANVSKRLDDFVRIQMDFTKTTDAVKALKKEYGIRGLPTIIFMDSKGNRLSKKTLTGFMDAEKFLKHIEGIK